MRVDVVTEISIAKSLMEVAAFVADPDNAPLWYDNIKSVEWISAPGVRVGAEVAFVARFLGRRLAYTYAVVDYDPSSHLIMKTAQGPFPMETHYRWSAIGDGKTTFTLRNCGNPAGFASLAAAPMSAAMRRANEKDLARLKLVLESR